MKLRNLFIASLAVCSMASCSKDDDGISTPQEVDAYFSIATTTNVMTRASSEGDSDSGTGREATVNSLTAYVFTNDDAAKYVTSKHVSLEKGGLGEIDEDYTTNVDGNSITSIKGIHVKVAKPAKIENPSVSKFKVVLLANTNHRSVTDLASLKQEVIADITTYNKEGIGKAYLPMHSDELTVGGLKISDDTKHVLNWYSGSGSSEQTTTTDGSHKGDPAKGAAKISLYRSLSRVQFTSLKTNFSALQYKNLSLTVKSIFLANVRANATVMGKENTEAAFYKGAYPGVFKVLQFLIEPSNGDKFVKTSFNKTYKDFLVGTEGMSTQELAFDTYINVNSPESIKEIPFSVADNGYKREEGDGAYQTRLVIEGELKDNGNSLGIRYFHIPLKLVDDAGNVDCNKFFKISATITGEGSPNPDEILENTCIDFSIVIDDWKVVNQHEDDTN